MLPTVCTESVERLGFNGQWFQWGSVDLLLRPAWLPNMSLQGSATPVSAPRCPTCPIGHSLAVVHPLSTLPHGLTPSYRSTLFAVQTEGGKSTKWPTSQYTAVTARLLAGVWAGLVARAEDREVRRIDLKANITAQATATRHL